MADSRTAPFPAYNYLVSINGINDPGTLLGGFSDVSGLSTEIHISEYRNGNELEAHVRKIPGSHKNGDVTLKRGVVNSADLWTWMTNTRKFGVAAQTDVTVTLRDEAGNNVQNWVLRSVVPMKYTGPTLAGKGGGEVAMEEIVLSVEGFDITAAS